VAIDIDVPNDLQPFSIGTAVQRCLLQLKATRSQDNIKIIEEEHKALLKCVIGLFGLPREITSMHEVEVELGDEASLADVIAALRMKIPKLEGPVICDGEDKLTEYYAFNINGRFYTDDKEIRIRFGDNMALLALPTGG